jgi:LysM repeat protein
MVLRKVALLFVPAMLVFCCVGCSKSVAWLDSKDQKSTLIQKAQMKREEGDVDAAIVLYIDALERNPSLARAHLDVALLLHGYAKDYVGAIYHYKRYLTLRPESEKKLLIEHRIRLASQDFTGGVLENGRLHVGTGESVSDLKERISTLELKNNELQRQVTELSRKRKSRRPQGEPVVSTPIVVRDRTIRPVRQVAESSGSARSSAQSYRVIKGDSLQKIAKQFYGDASKWPRVYFANKDKIDKPAILHAGIVLTIPQIEASSEE